MTLAKVSHRDGGHGGTLFFPPSKDKEGGVFRVLLRGGGVSERHSFCVCRFGLLSRSNPDLGRYIESSFTRGPVDASSPQEGGGGGKPGSG